MTHFQVKVCGLTRSSDAALAAELGADMIGLIFYDGSRRSVSPAKAREIARTLTPVVDRVGVFVDEKIKVILQLAEKCRLDWVQLHGQYSSAEIRLIQETGVKVIRAFQSSTAVDWKPITNSNADLVMIDNSMGTGRAFDCAPPKKPVANLMLSGGVSTENLSRGIKLYHPVVVDVNSSVESKPGIKSKARMTEFFRLCNEIRYGK